MFKSIFYKRINRNIYRENLNQVKMTKTSFLFLLSQILLLIILALDWTIMFDIKSRASIAMKQFDSVVSYSTISIWSILLDFSLIILYFVPYLFHIKSRVSSRFLFIRQLVLVALLLIFAIKEVITVKFMNCFNHYDQILVKIRVFLTFAFIILAVTISLNDLVDLLRTKVARIIDLTPTIIIILTLIVSFGYNIVLLARLNSEFDKDISKNTIKFGIFSKDEIDLIKKGMFVRDDKFDHRIVGTLGDLINSENKENHVKECILNDDYCKRYYRRAFKKYIKCEDVFTDCESISDLVITLKYIDYENEYPTYECQTKNDNLCSIACREFKEKNYNIYLIQDFGNKIEMAWNNFERCEEIKPIAYLKTSNSTYVDNYYWC